VHGPACVPLRWMRPTHGGRAASLSRLLFRRRSFCLSGSGGCAFGGSRMTHANSLPHDGAHLTIAGGAGQGSDTLGRMTPSRSRFLPVRGLRYHLREWGEPGAPMIFMLHGWMDVSASFQFVVDALDSGWHVMAPDWRGFGQTEWRGDAYWFPDYLGDLDAILHACSPEEPVNLVGHSLGGNVACVCWGASGAGRPSGGAGCLSGWLIRGPSRRRDVWRSG
jgi:hypothetical protein